MMNRCILFLPQHHQGDDNNSGYDNPSNHKPDNGAFIGPNILSKKDLPLKKGTIDLYRGLTAAGEKINATMISAMLESAGFHTSF